MSGSERKIQNEVLLAAREHGMTLWRNNTGQAWVGDAQRMGNGLVQIRNARPLHSGLCKGSSDLIGLRRVTVTPEMVGQQVAIFAAVEIKTTTGKLSDHQRHFLAFVRDAGGAALLARCADDLGELS